LCDKYLLRRRSFAAITQFARKLQRDDSPAKIAQTQFVWCVSASRQRPAREGQGFLKADGRMVL
jgi:hypothetical protein